jgi:hypothetical protein
MQALLPALRFLDPPCGCGPVRLDRYSAYAERPQDYGLHDVVPLATYRYLYPFPEASLREIAYAFDYAYPAGEEPWDRARPLIDAVAHWQSVPETGAPRLRRDPDGRPFIEDTRSDAAATRRDLDPLEERVFTAAADICSRAQLQVLVESSFPGRDDLEAAVDDALAAFLDARLMVVDGARYLSLALPEDTKSAAYALSAADAEGAADARTAPT